MAFADPVGVGGSGGSKWLTVSSVSPLFPSNGEGGTIGTASASDNVGAEETWIDGIDFNAVIAGEVVSLYQDDKTTLIDTYIVGATATPKESYNFDPPIRLKGSTKANFSARTTTVGTTARIRYRRAL